MKNSYIGFIMAIERAEISTLDPSFGVISSTEIEPTKRPLIETLLFSNSTDPRRENLSREERVRLHYAQTLAKDNTEELLPRYRTSDYDPDNPFADRLAADPLSDPEVIRLAGLIRISEESKKS